MSDKVKNGACVIVKCCDCGLEHLWKFDIKRGKHLQDDEVELTVTRKEILEERKAGDAK